MSIHRAPIFFKPDLSDDGARYASLRLQMTFEIDPEHIRDVVLTEEILQVIYSNILEKEDLWSATKQHLLNKQVKVITLFVRDQGELDCIVKFIGSHVDPRKCHAGSLRRMLGGGKEKIPNSEKSWFENRIHRPRTLEEAQAHFGALFADEVRVTT